MFPESLFVYTTFLYVSFGFDLKFLCLVTIVYELFKEVFYECFPDIYDRNFRVCDNTSYYRIELYLK